MTFKVFIRPDNAYQKLILIVIIKTSSDYEVLW